MKPPNAGQKFPAEVYTRDDVERLLAVCSRRGHAGVRDRALIAVLWRCGLRIAEALALEPKDVDLDRRTLVVLRGKGSKRRVLGIDTQTAALLELWLRRRRALGVGPARPLFCTISRPNVGAPIQSSVWRETLKLLGRRAGIEKRVHPHGFRHTFAVDMSREGKSIPEISKALGHADFATTQRYVDHLEPAALILSMQTREWEPVNHWPPLAA